MPGISGFSAYLPPHRVNLADWCDWTDQPAGKVAGVIGDSFRMAGPEQDVYALAASAAVRLIEAYDVDASAVGMLVLGTESASDNAAGAVILRGMLDDYLASRGRAPLAADCEVPEIKHACLGGIYGLKQALRYLATDGAGRQAIVVSADIAEYARGSSGEATQGAGAVAMLLEAEPRLLSVDLGAAGRASRYRGADFRKPFARYPGQRTDQARPRDFPVFNGRYSTACYLDTVASAFDDMAPRPDAAGATDWDAVFLHRPYARMPETAWAMLCLRAWLADDPHTLRAFCHEVGVDAVALAAELTPGRDIGPAGDIPLDAERYPATTALIRAWRRREDYRDVVLGRLGPGQAAMRACGNLYTGSLPAWLAAGLSEAAEQAEPGPRWLAIGYGSGDAAEVLPLTLVPGWRAVAGRIGFRAALDGAVDLDQAGYEALHEGRMVNPAAGNGAFVIDHIGDRDEPGHVDAGIPRYAWA